MRETTSNLLAIISELGQDMQKEQDSYEAENDAWWNGLTLQEREDAFYAVVKRIYKGEIIDKGTYRYILYDVFGFDGSMYMRGMDCGYMTLHNAIVNADTGEQV
jgi:hypothetical protein